MSRKVKKSAAKVTRRGRSSTSRISSKNQVTIPVEILRAVNLKSGDTVKFFAEREGQIVVTKDEDPEWKIALRELIGSEPGLSERCDYKEEREKWDATLTDFKETIKHGIDPSVFLTWCFRHVVRCGPTNRGEWFNSICYFEVSRPKTPREIATD